jgi:hypothetical protein
MTTKNSFAATFTPVAENSFGVRSWFMKKIVLTFGVISGVISSVMMLGTVSFIDRIGFDKGVIVGYTVIVLSFVLVFFGIRSYRENVGNGSISFGRAFTVGILITLVSCLFYVVSWEIVSFSFFPDFVEKYNTYMIDQVRASGAGPAEVAAEMERLKNFAEMYKNPLYNAAFTFLEPFPVGLLITLISALILRRKRKESEPPAVITPAVQSMPS